MKAVTANSDLKKDICRACCHPVNRTIVELLSEENLSFTQIKNKLDGSCDSGKFGYHLRRLRGFIEFEPSTKKYKLTYRGRLLSNIIHNFNIQIQKGNQPVRYAEQLTVGDHAFALYDSESFKHDITFPFLEAGLSKGNAVFCAVGEEKLDTDILALKKYGIDLDSLPKGALTVMPSYEWYIQKGKAKAKTIIENWQRLVEEKKEAGFAGLQVTSENETFIDNGKTEELLCYEESLGKQFSLGMSAICLYDKKRIEEIGVSQIFKGHGNIISEETWGKTDPFSRLKQMVSM